MQTVFLFIIADIRSDGFSSQNKLNVNAPEFTVMNRDAQHTQPLGFFSPNTQFLQHSKSSNNIQQQIQLAAARRQAVQMANLSASQAILVSHPLRLQQLGMGISVPQPSSHAINSTSEVHVNVSISTQMILSITFFYFSFIIYFVDRTESKICNGFARQ